MMLGNLLENAFHASQKLPPEQRQVKVLARMLSPAMLGPVSYTHLDVYKRQILSHSLVIRFIFEVKRNPFGKIIRSMYIGYIKFI